MAAPLNVELVSATGQVWTGQATFVVATTTEGELGILANHEPLLAVLGSSEGSEVRITLEDGSKIEADADDGFLSVDQNTVRIFARDAKLLTK